MKMSLIQQENLPSSIILLFIIGARKKDGIQNIGDRDKLFCLIPETLGKNHQIMPFKCKCVLILVEVIYSH